MEREREIGLWSNGWAQGFFLQNLCLGKAIDQLLLTEIPEGADGMDDSPDEGPGAVPGCGAQVATTATKISSLPMYTIWATFFLQS